MKYYSCLFVLFLPSLFIHVCFIFGLYLFLFVFFIHVCFLFTAPSTPSGAPQTPQAPFSPTGVTRTYVSFFSFFLFFYFHSSFCFYIHSFFFISFSFFFFVCSLSLLPTDAPFSPVVVKPEPPKVYVSFFGYSCLLFFPFIPFCFSFSF